MKIAVIDADLIGRKNHRFPNLCCMKISGYFKACGNFVTLKLDYDGLNEFDRVYVAKVFTDTPIPEGGMFGNPLDATNVIKGGTGFCFDQATPLPPQIEHAMPDYHLYDGVCDYKYYTDYSIGYLTRGCFRHCPFCVNRRSNKVVAHSPLNEFFDPTRKKICLLDDNFFGFDGWKDLLLELRATGKPFVFKQGLDVRLLDDEKAQLLFTSKYDGDFIFAFDDIRDTPIIKEKLELISRHVNTRSRRIKFYVLCGFDRSGRYDEGFWLKDLQDALDRAELLKRYNCLPYLMRHKDYQSSPQRTLYMRLAEWCNQPHLFLKKSFVEYMAYQAEYRKKFRGDIMKIIEPKAELFDFVDTEATMKKLEACGRVSHQSQPREGSAEKFVRMLIKRGHESVLEHVSLTFHIICDRAIMAELTRHRHCAFTVESTRYVKYDELTFIKSDGIKKWEKPDGLNWETTHEYDIWYQGILHSEIYYKSLLDDNLPPEQARAVLPLCLKTELYMTANLRELRHILKLRCAKAAHPQMRIIALSMLDTLYRCLPVIFEDIWEVYRDECT